MTGADRIEAAARVALAHDDRPETPDAATPPAPPAGFTLKEISVAAFFFGIGCGLWLLVAAGTLALSCEQVLR